MKTIKQEYHIMAPLERVWGAFVDEGEIDKWGGGPAKMSDKAGDEFELWGGDIHGKNLEVKKEKKLVQEWYGGDWDKPSTLEFGFSHKDGCTRVMLEHKGVPDNEALDIEKGWEQFYMKPMKDYLESER